MENTGFKKIRLNMSFDNEKNDKLNDGIEDVGKFATINLIRKCNNYNGNKKDYDCKKCKNRGFFYVADVMYDKEKNTRFWNSKVYICECEKQRQIIARENKSGLGKYLNWRSKDFIATKQWQQDLKDKVIDYCLNHTDDNLWISFWGQNGSGKTLMASVIANHFLYNKKRDVKYIEWTNFISRVKQKMFGDEDDKEEARNEIDMVKEVDILFIDEFMRNYKEADLKYIDEIINYRYCNNLKTIITSQYLFKDVLNVQESSISRIYEMCEGENFTIQIPYSQENNYRLKGMK